MCYALIICISIALPLPTGKLYPHNICVRYFQADETLITEQEQVQHISLLSNFFYCPIATKIYSIYIMIIQRQKYKTLDSSHRQ